MSLTLEQYNKIEDSEALKVHQLAAKICFDFGERVRYKNKIGRDEGMVVAVSLRPNGLSYAVVWSDKSESWHYEFELELLAS